MRIAVLDVKSIGEGLDYSPLYRLGDVEMYDYTSREDVVDRLKDIEVTVSNKIIYDESILSQLPKLKLICMTGTGYNHIDVNAAAEHGIGVTNVVDYCTDSVAQHTLAMVFHLLNNIGYYMQYVQSGLYIGDEDFTHFEKTYREVSKLQWGIVGMGNIGRRVAEIAQSFGASVVYYSTSGKNVSQAYKHLALDELLSSCDIITIHAPLNDSTRGLFGYEQFRQMKKDAVIVNVGRGGIIDEHCIEKVLNENLVTGIGLDVLTSEPMTADSPLRNLVKDSRLLITPHVAWASLEARQRVITEVADNIDAFVKGVKRNRVEY